MQQANKTARRFTFTSYVNTDVITGDRSHIKYAIWQREVCPTTQREHWQGYIHVKTPCRYSKIQEILGDPVAHVEIAGGTPEQNHTYCTKADSRKPGTQPIEIGTLAATGQGKRKCPVTMSQCHEVAGNTNRHFELCDKIFKRYPSHDISI